MVVEETWGVPIERAKRFLVSQQDITQQETGYSFRTCHITLTELDFGMMGKIPFPRTLLHIEGPETEANAIHRRFLIQFLSAGG